MIKHQLIMKRKSTYFLRFVLSIIGLGVIALCVFALPEMWKGGSLEYPTASLAIRLIMIGMYLTAIPFFLGLWQTFKLLNYIDQNIAFSDLSVKALKKIKYYATIIAAFYIIGYPLLYPIAQADDAPGLIVIGMGIACTPVAVAVFASILEKLLQRAIEMKSENDLTI